MTLDRLLDELLDREGGYVDHPMDRGGPTKFGITLETLRDVRRPAPVDALDVYGLSRIEAKDIYRRRYVYDPGYAEAIADDRLLALVVDYAVHSGPGKATKALQRALGVTDDGVLGSQTKRLLAAQEGSQDVYRKLLAGRIGFLVRHGLSLLGGVLVANGWVDDASWTKLVVEASPAIVAWALGQIVAARNKQKVAVALTLPAGATHDDLAKALKVV